MSSRPNDLKSRMQQLFETKELADCTFLVGVEKLPVKGHKNILSVASPVLREMLKQVSEDHPKVPITDTEPEVFQAVLKYIYTDTVDVNGNIVSDVVTAAKIYQLPGLLKGLDHFIADHLTPKTVLEAYSLVLHTTDSDLKKKCEEIIKTKTKEVLADSSFVEACHDVIEAVLSMEYLDIDSELDLLRAVDRYAKHNSCDETSIRNFLAKIRFLSLLPEEFDKALSTTSLLTATDALGILAHIVFDKSEVQFPSGFSLRKGRNNENLLIPTETGLWEKLKCKIPDIKNVLNQAKDAGAVWSATFYFNNLKWKVYIKNERNATGNYLSTNLHCYLENKPATWSCSVFFRTSLKIRGASTDITMRKIWSASRQVTYGQKIITISELLDPNNRCIKDGAVTFEFFISTN
ncbi:hypothetical protein ABMA28_009604 [Loxostege sticticalis]|uniref:BTB domain-containing protein n=1 Tax=Loxostege sticticalis TaxID=481309 RepID=A0ABD0SAU4_LOXSC